MVISLRQTLIEDIVGRKIHAELQMNSYVNFVIRFIPSSAFTRKSRLRSIVSSASSTLDYAFSVRIVNLLQIMHIFVYYVPDINSIYRTNIINSGAVYVK